MGIGIVEAVENWQLLCLPVPVCVGHAHEHWPDNVTLRIYQPRAIHDDGPLRSWHLTQGRIRAVSGCGSGQRIDGAVDGENEANVGPHCAHCMHAVGCQALTQSVYKIADLTTSTARLPSRRRPSNWATSLRCCSGCRNCSRPAAMRWRKR